MLWVGVVLLILGFAFAIPRAGAPGSIAHRNVTMGSYIIQTPGQTHDDDSSSKAWRIHALGVLMVLAGIAILMFVA